MKKKPRKITIGYRIERHSPNYVDYWTGRTWTREKAASMVFARKSAADRRANKIRFGTSMRVKVIRVYRGDA